MLIYINISCNVDLTDLVSASSKVENISFFVVVGWSGEDYKI